MIAAGADLNIPEGFRSGHFVRYLLKQRHVRRYFTSFFCIVLTNYLLTDYKAYEKGSKH
jgi:hypothetical protein